MSARPGKAQPPPADPVAATFLGRQAGAGGPFALLGLPHEQRDPAQIREAAARRLGQVDRHPLRLTPEADEIRLAIHTAAAQLADLALHAELVRHWPPGEPEQIPVAWRAHLDEVSESLARRARQIVGASGGWNPRARRRLAHIARLHRVTAADLLRAVRPKVASARTGKPGGRAIRTLAIPSIAPPTSTGRFWLAVHASLASMLVVMLVMTGIELWRPRPAVTVDDGVMTAEAPAGEPDRPLVPGPRSNIAHHAALEQELRNILLMAADRPDEAAARGERAIGTFLDRWEEAPTDARDRIAGLLTELAARTVPSPAAASTLLAPITAAIGSEHPPRVAAAAALAAIMRDAPDLPRPVRDRAAAAVSTLNMPLSQGFDQGVIDALRARVAAIDPESVEGWTAWSDALAAASGGSASSRVQTRLLALESVLRRDAPASPRWRRIAGVLAQGLTWNASDPATAWLLEQLDDPSVRTDRVAALTAVVATEVSAPGIDPSMVLRPDADEPTRRALLNDYRIAWLSAPRGEGTARSDVITAIGSALNRSPTAPEDRLAWLVELARVNASAAVLFAGDEADAAALLAETPATSTIATASTPAANTLDDSWGIELLNANTPEAILRVVPTSLPGRTTFSALAAEAVVTQALLGPSREVRDAARSLVVAHGDDVQILLALERAAARRPTAAVGELIAAITGANLPDRRDGAWPDLVRRALLPVIADRVSAADPGPLVLGELTLAELSARRIGESADTAYLRSLLRETGIWLARNDLPGTDRLSAAAIDARRTALASGAAARVQLSAVQHRTLVEAIAGVAASRAVRPRPSVERLLRSMADGWADAPTVIDQLIVSHRAEAELWRSILEANP